MDELQDKLVSARKDTEYRSIPGRSPNHSLTSLEDNQIMRERTLSFRDVAETTNPFDARIRWTCWNVFKAILLGCTLVPIRLVLIIALFILITPIAILASIGTKPNPKNPSGCFRKMLLWPTRLAARLLLFLLGYYWISVKNDHHGPMPPILICNHIAMTDVVFLWWYCGFSAVAFDGVKNMPIIGRLAMGLQCIFVDRADPNSKHTTADAIMYRSQHGGFPPLLIFPEGGCTNGSCVITFKSGPFRPGTTILPFTIRYPCRFFNPSTCGPGGTINLVWSLFQFYNCMKIHVLPAYTPTTVEQGNTRFFTSNVREIYGRTLKLPLTKHSYEDMFLAAAARGAKVDQNFEMVSLKKVTGLDRKQIQEMLKEFKKIATCGTIEFQDFHRVMNIENEKQSRNLFALFDEDGSGSIDFRELLLGLSLMSNDVHYNMDRRMHWAYHLFDCDGTGFVSLNNLKQILSKIADPEEMDEILDGVEQKDEAAQILFEEFKAIMEKHQDLIHASIIHEGKDHVAFAMPNEKPTSASEVSTTGGCVAFVEQPFVHQK